MLLRGISLLALSIPDLAQVPAWAWFALGGATGILLAPGVAAFTARRSRRQRPISGKPKIPSALRRRIDQLEDNLGAATAARESLLNQLEKSQELSLERLRLLEAMADVSLPALSTMENELTAALAEHSSESALDRRQRYGGLARDLRELGVLVRDLLTLGRVEGHDAPARVEPVELEKELQRAHRGCPALVLEVAEEVPELVLSDRGLLGVAFEKIAAASRSAAGAVHLHISTEMMRSGLHALTFEYHGLPSFPKGIREHFSAGDLAHVPHALVAAGLQTLELAVAGRAIERLGGSVSLHTLKDGREQLQVHLVLSSAPDRRSVLRPEVAHVP